LLGTADTRQKSSGRPAAEFALRSDQFMAAQLGERKPERCGLFVTGMSIHVGSNQPVRA
jgi:hypothetical protein